MFQITCLQIFGSFTKNKLLTLFHLDNTLTSKEGVFLATLSPSSKVPSSSSGKKADFTTNTSKIEQLTTKQSSRITGFFISG